jgi:hypothetical protein
MSLIGKKVKYKKYNEEHQGVIMDKFIDQIPVKQECPVGDGRAYRFDQYISGHFYLIEKEDKTLHKVPCGNLIKLI